MRKIILWSISLLLFFPAIKDLTFAQRYSYKQQLKAVNAIFVELGGNSLIFSLNYERLLTDNLGIRTGIGPTFPFLINFYSGRDHRLEFGIGILYLQANISGESKTEVRLTAAIGYRFQPQNGGIVFRATFTPFYDPEKGNFLPFAGLSFGKCF